MFETVATRCLLIGLLMFSGLFSQLCGGGRRHERVFIVDASASVEQQSIDECFTAFEDSNRFLKRGTRLAFIPVTSDAVVDAPGRIRRFEIGERREAYDNDLRRAMRKMKSELGVMRDSSMADQFRQTDLLGAISQAVEEFAGGDVRADRTLVVLSDFLQDDRSYRFTSDSRLAGEAEALRFARDLAASRRLNLRGARVYLGMVRSRDLQTMPTERRLAVRAFWREFMKMSGASTVEDATDGPGLMVKFISEVDK